MLSPCSASGSAVYRWRLGSSSTTSSINVITPSTEELFITVAEAQAADVERAVASARAAFDRGPWPRMSHGERAQFLVEIGQEIAARVANLSAIWTSETGIVRGLSDPLVAGVRRTYDYYASLAAGFPFGGTA